MLVFENVVSDKIFNTRYPIKGILWFNSKSKKKKSEEYQIILGNPCNFAISLFTLPQLSLLFPVSL